MDSHRSRRGQRRAGFTIIELMVVVTITGILAAIAIPTFTGYIYKSRTSEATEFLGEIKLRQEAHRAEFGAYHNQGSTSFDPNDFVPTLTSFSGGAPVAWPTDPDFAIIGARPDGAVRFGYQFAAGLPSSLPPSQYGMTSANADHWMIAQARGDLDGDGAFCTFEIMNVTRTVWFSPDKGWE